MAEIKIAVSDKTNKLIQEIADSLGIKKSEFVKNIVIENLKDIAFNENKVRKKG